MNALIVVSGIALSATAQIAMKFAAQKPAFSATWWVLAAGAAAAYAISFLLYLTALRRADLSSLSPLMAVAVSLIVSVAALVLFGERADLRRIAGILLALASLWLLAA